METDKILLRFHLLLQQNVIQFSQNPNTHQKRHNDVLRGIVDIDVSPYFEKYILIFSF